MSCSIVDADGYLSRCIIDRAEDAVNLLILPFALVRIFRLWYRRRATKPSHFLYWPLGLGLAIAALSLGTRDLLDSILWYATLAAVLCLKYVQVGRVDVALPEILWYFFVQILVLAARISAFFSWVLIAPLVLNIAILVLEIVWMPALPRGYDSSTIFGKITVSYMDGMLKTATGRQIDRSEFAKPPRNLNSFNAYSKFQIYLSKFEVSSKFRVIFSIIRTLQWRIIMITLLDVASDLITYVRPTILSFFLASLRTYRDGTTTIQPSVYYAVLLALIQLVSTSMDSLQSLVSNTAFTSTRSALMGSIYRKALDLSPKARETYDNAKIMNLLNVDTAMVQLVYSQIPTLIGAPLGLVVCTWQLYQFLGLSTIAALPVYGLFIPYSGWYTKRMLKRFPEMMAVKDKRTKATWSVFQSMKSLKLYAWEDPYTERVEEERDKEIGVQAKYLKLQSAMNCVSTMLDDVVATAIFIAYLYITGNPLTPEIVFPALSLLSFLSGPFFAFPRSISSLGRAITSQERINDFLTQQEHTEANYHRLPHVGPSDFETPTVVIDNATFYWTEEIIEEKLALQDVSLSLQRGDLCCIVGRVGTGKTALLKAICGQMKIATGSVTVKGHIAYASQEPWLQFKSIKDNILFGLTYDESFYNQTIKACQLESDLELFSERDETEIGEKGIRLSGGQKARVALARAVYSRADIYVLDDILAAVDEHVAAHLMRDLLAPNGLLAGKTIILGTNSRKVLKLASQIIALEKKTIKNDESVSVIVEELDKQATPMTETSDDTETPEVSDRRKELKPPAQAPRPVLYIDAPMSSVVTSQQKSEEEDQRVDPLKVFARYIKSVGAKTYLSAIVFMILSVVFTNVITIWLTIWSDQELSGIHAARWYIVVYLLLSLLAGVTLYLSVYWFLGAVGNTASVKLHNAMLESVVRSPMAFFESTPLGSIMNRFTGDMSTLDSTLPSMIYFFSRSVLGMIISFTIMLAGAPFVIFILVPLLFVYNRYRQYYIPLSRQLQRMSQASRGPILSMIEESVKGVNTIRAFDTVSQFIDAYEHLSDYWMTVVFLRASLNQWLNWRINAMTAIMTLASALTTVFIVANSGMSVGVVGIVLLSTQRGGMMLSRIIRSVADLEVSAVAVERILEYTDLEPEAPRAYPSDPSPEEWPLSGKVELSNYSVRYRPDLEDVLHGINLAIQSKEKIGIVGRTGAGKSTITLALFRLIEPSEGHITIDGRNTSDLGLYTLRSRLSIIPQDAQIFKGTVRQNLDPLGTSDDVRLWQILELCHLKEHFTGLGSGLDTELADAGENLSRGQAQLICLGRSLVHESRILVLDEATASVDTETDQILQQTIRSQFTDRTIITIAHRLDTIMDSDRVVVLDKGEIKEFDTPANLLAAKGLFYALTQAEASKPSGH